MMKMENMKKIEVKGRFVIAYSDEWKEKKVVGYLKKGMTLSQWIENKALYAAKNGVRDKLIRQLIHFARQAERRRDPSRFIDQCLMLERKLDRLMTVK